MVTHTCASSCSRRHLGTLQHTHEALAAKGKPDSLKYVLDITVKMVNFVKARPLNSRVFSKLCNDIGSNHAMLLQHAEVRWLSSIDTYFFYIERRA